MLKWTKTSHWTASIFSLEKFHSGESDDSKLERVLTVTLILKWHLKMIL